MKSCCFGGEDDTLVMSGSDDFNVYAWRVPEEGGGGWVSRAQHVLQGHRSIVNQVVLDCVSLISNLNVVLIIFNFR